MARKSKVLFLCTGNSCRSQMAEGWTKFLHAGELEAYSAGVESHGLNPVAVEVMAEAGVDISTQTSKMLESMESIKFDAVITVCGHAQETCPIFPGSATVIHRDFDDPPRLAAGAANDKEAKEFYRRVRDEIRDFVKTLPVALAR